MRASSQIAVFDFTRLLPISHYDIDVQQFKSHPADFGVPDALRKGQAQMSRKKIHYQGLPEDLTPIAGKVGASAAGKVKIDKTERSRK